MEESLKDLIDRIIVDLKDGKIDGRIKEVTRHPQYAILKNEAVVTVRTKEGLEVVIDITDKVL